MPFPKFNVNNHCYPVKIPEARYCFDDWLLYGFLTDFGVRQTPRVKRGTGLAIKNRIELGRQMLIRFKSLVIMIPPGSRATSLTRLRGMKFNS